MVNKCDVPVDPKTMRSLTCFSQSNQSDVSVCCVTSVWSVNWLISLPGFPLFAFAMLVRVLIDDDATKWKW